MDDAKESILTSIKKLVGITEEYNHFDSDIIMFINSVFLDLSQIGVGSGDFQIVDDGDLWTDYLPEGELLSAVRTFVYLKVKLLFDPPSNSGAVESINRQIDKLEWRINIEVDRGQDEEEENQNG